MNQYETLKAAGYNKEQIWQLLYLRKYNVDSYEKAVVSLTQDISAEKMEQIIKCIVHDINCSLLIKDINNLSVLQMNELRRYLEDILVISKPDNETILKYTKLAERMIYNKFDEHMLYQARRFIKVENPLNPENLSLLINKLIQYNVKEWPIADYMFTTFKQEGIYGLFKMLSSKQFDLELEVLRQMRNTDNEISYVVDHFLRKEE